MSATVGRRLVAELLGTGLLVTVVVGSGIAAQELSPGDVGVQLLESSTATFLGLTLLILLGGQLLSSYGAEVAKRIDVLGAAIHNGNAVAQLAELDPFYIPPLGSPRDALQQAGHAWQAAQASSA